MPLVKHSTTCGICEQSGATVHWRNPLSNFAHPVCLRWIHQENIKLQAVLAKHFPEPGFYRNLAQVHALEALKEKISEASILQSKQSGKLADCFSSVIENAINEFSMGTKFTPCFRIMPVVLNDSD
ncbi:MAG: hypothetical protein JSR57_02505 [Verrucomicrobia bacterium]|nr:hypothetical protein [Verrucomicrobiota bacterium]